MADLDDHILSLHSEASVDVHKHSERASCQPTKGRKHHSYNRVMQEHSDFYLKPRCLPPEYRWNEYFAAMGSYLLNITLILLIVYRSNKEIRVYSRVLLASCVFDLFFATACFVVELVSTTIRGRIKLTLSARFLQKW